MKSIIITNRTKKAIRIWRGRGVRRPVLLDDDLATHRPNFLIELFTEVNREFKNEKNFPMSLDDWNSPPPLKVRDVRDKVANTMKVTP